LLLAAGSTWSRLGYWPESECECGLGSVRASACWVNTSGCTQAHCPVPVSLSFLFPECGKHSSIVKKIDKATAAMLPDCLIIHRGRPVLCLHSPSSTNCAFSKFVELNHELLMRFCFLDSTLGEKLVRPRMHSQVK
jgi:hypothetical protein